MERRYGHRRCGLFEAGRVGGHDVECDLLAVGQARCGCRVDPGRWLTSAIGTVFVWWQTGCLTGFLPFFFFFLIWALGRHQVGGRGSDGNATPLGSEAVSDSVQVCFTHLTAVIADVGAAVSAATAAVVALRAVLTPPGLLACTMQTSGEPTRLLGA